MYEKASIHVSIIEVFMWMGVFACFLTRLCEEEICHNCSNADEMRILGGKYYV